MEVEQAMSCWSVLEADLMVDNKVGLGLGLGFDVPVWEPGRSLRCEWECGWEWEAGICARGE